MSQGKEARRRRRLGFSRQAQPEESGDWLAGYRPTTMERMTPPRRYRDTEGAADDDAPSAVGTRQRETALRYRDEHSDDEFAEDDARAYDDAPGERRYLPTYSDNADDYHETPGYRDDAPGYRDDAPGYRDDAPGYRDDAHDERRYLPTYSDEAGDYPEGPGYRDEPPHGDEARRFVAQRQPAMAQRLFDEPPVAEATPFLVGQTMRRDPHGPGEQGEPSAYAEPEDFPPTSRHGAPTDTAHRLPPGLSGAPVDLGGPLLPEPRLALSEPRAGRRRAATDDQSERPVSSVVDEYAAAWQPSGPVPTFSARVGTEDHDAGPAGGYAPAEPELRPIISPLPEFSPPTQPTEPPPLVPIMPKIGPESSSARRLPRSLHGSSRPAQRAPFDPMPGYGPGEAGDEPIDFAPAGDELPPPGYPRQPHEFDPDGPADFLAAEAPGMGPGPGWIPEPRGDWAPQDPSDPMAYRREAYPDPDPDAGPYFTAEGGPAAYSAAPMEAGPYFTAEGGPAAYSPAQLDAGPYCPGESNPESYYPDEIDPDPYHGEGPSADGLYQSGPPPAAPHGWSGRSGRAGLADDDDDDPDEAARHRSARRWMIALSAVGIVVLLGACAFGTYGMFSDDRKTPSTAQPTPSVAASRDISSRAVDARPLSEGEVFPAGSEVKPLATEAGYKVLKTQANSDCKIAATETLGTLLVNAGCNQVVRATLKHPTGQYLVTAGLFNLNDATSARQAHDGVKPAIDAQKGRFTGLLAGDGTDALVRAPTQLGWNTKGHFMAYCVIARTDGKAFESGDVYPKQIIFDVVGTYLLDDIVGARANPGGHTTPAGPAATGSATAANSGHSRPTASTSSSKR